MRTPRQTMTRRNISFYIITYNQKDFVAAAIEAAFAQDYPKLEIVISDDNSTDGTWDIILDTVQKCQQNNPQNHKVVLNRNEENLGICKHINKVVDICSNDIIVCSAGDDISKNDRVSKTVECFDDPDVMMVSSMISYINEQGELLADRDNKRYTAVANPDNIASGKFIPVGCAIACRKSCYNFLNHHKLPDECSYEDVILGMRASLLGKIAQLKEPLVYYRISQNSLTNFDKKSPDLYKKKKAMALHSFLATKAQLDDLTFYIRKFPEKQKQFLKTRHILRNRVARKEQTYWISQYPLPKVILLKLTALFKGKNFFSFLIEVVKSRKNYIP